MIKTVLFDLGGVLMRTEDLQPRKELAARYDMSFEELTDLIYRMESAWQATLGEISAEEHWEEVRKKFALSPQEIERFKESYWAGDTLDEQLIDFIQGLNSEYTTGLLSNAWSDLRKALTEDWEIIDVFQHVFISAELGLAKPDPKIYYHVVEEVDCQPHEIVFLDDMIENVESARQVGLNAIHFRSREQALGELRELLDNEL